jgi:hypothetical protein
LPLDGEEEELLLKSAFKDHPLWYAESLGTGATAAECPEVPDVWASWTWSFWSSGAEADVPRVANGPVFTTVLNGALPEFEAMTFPTSGAAAKDGGAGDAAQSTTPPEPPPDTNAPPPGSGNEERGSSVA